MFIRTSRCFDSHVCGSKCLKPFFVCFEKFLHRQKRFSSSTKLICMASIPLLPHRCEFRCSFFLLPNRVQGARCLCFGFWGSRSSLHVFAWPNCLLTALFISCWEHVFGLFPCFLSWLLFSLFPVVVFAVRKQKCSSARRALAEPAAAIRKCG